MKQFDEEKSELKASKCKFLTNEVKWLVHQSSRVTVMPNDPKIEAVKKLNPFKVSKQLKPFLGSLYHLANFVIKVITFTENLQSSVAEKEMRKKL